MVVGFTTICTISAYHHKSCEFESRSWRDVLDTTLNEKVCQWLKTGRWFSPGAPISFTKKTDRHDITAILLKVGLCCLHIYLYLEVIGQATFSLTFILIVLSLPFLMISCFLFHCVPQCHCTNVKFKSSCNFFISLWQTNM